MPKELKRSLAPPVAPWAWQFRCRLRQSASVRAGPCQRPEWPELSPAAPATIEKPAKHDIRDLRCPALPVARGVTRRDGGSVVDGPSVRQRVARCGRQVADRQRHRAHDCGIKGARSVPESASAVPSSRPPGRSRSATSCSGAPQSRPCSSRCRPAGSPCSSACRHSSGPARCRRTCRVHRGLGSRHRCEPRFWVLCRRHTPKRV